MSRNTSTLAEVGDAVTDGLSDAWAATTALAHDLASSAAGAATDLGHQIRPRPRRRVQPWLYGVIALAAVVAVGWWRRRRQANEPTATDEHLSPVAPHTETARAAAG